MRILLKDNQRYSRPKRRKLTTQEDVSSTNKNGDVNRTLNELDAKISFEEKELPTTNLTHMNEKDPNVLKRKRLKRTSGRRSSVVPRRREKRIWEGPVVSDSSIDRSSTECESSWFSLPQHCLVPCLSDGDHDNSWVMLSETPSISVEVRPRRCMRHYGCQDPICQASRVDTSIPQIRNTTRTSASCVHQDNFTSSDILSSEALAMISRVWFDFEELLIPFVRSKTHEYQNPDCPILPITQDALGITEGGVNQPEYSILHSTECSILHRSNSSEYHNDCDNVDNIPETLTIQNHKKNAYSSSRPKSRKTIVTPESAVVTTPISLNEKWIIDEINSEENDTAAKLITDPDNYQRAQDFDTIFSDEDLNEEVFAAAEELLKNYSPVQCEFIDFELPDDF